MRMILKRVLLLALCFQILMPHAPVRARSESGVARQVKTGKHKRRTRPRKTSQAGAPQVLLPVRPEFNRKATLSGTIISLDAADRFTLRDERGLDTIVLLFPETLYRIENPTGALSNADAGMIKRGAKVTVEGLLNSDYQMKAVVVKTKRNAV